LVRELATRLGLSELLDGLTLKQRQRGYSPAESAMAIVETLAAAGECLDDVELLRADSAQELLRGGPVPTQPRWGVSFAASTSATSANSTAPWIGSSSARDRSSTGRPTGR
jgi:hypothetical protein